MKKDGFLYIISNPAHPEFLKVGVTQDDDIKKRLNTYQTGDPKRKYVVEFYLSHPDCYEAEKRIKKMMKYFSKDSIQKGEWYQISLPIAISRLQEQVDDYNEGLYK